MLTSTSTEQKKQAHGLTQDEMSRLQISQQYEEGIEFVTAKNKRDDGSEYKFPAHERHLIHVEMETPNFDQRTGQKLSVPSIQTFYPKDFERMEKESAFAGQKVTILHNPETDNDIKGVEQHDYLTPQIMSQPGAGTPLTETVAKMSAEELRTVYLDLYPEMQDKPLPSRAEAEKQVVDKVAFLGDEAKTDELKQTHENRMRALGLIK